MIKMTKIEVKGLCKKIGNEEILRNIDLELSSGKIYGFIGRNGSGKSMLLKSICGFIRPDKGKIIVDGVDIYLNNVFPKDTSALLDQPNYIPDLSGFENLKMIASIQNKIDDNKIIDTLEKVNLIDEKDKKFKKYSLGMKQKLAIAQALMENPKIIILDEPFNGLEEESADKIRKILIDEKKNGKIILIATHIKDDINNLCDVIYNMKNGKINN